MGCVKSIDRYSYPKQGRHLNSRVEVCFHYNTAETIGGTIVRDDVERPGETIIRLDDGRYVRATECQYSICIPLRKIKKEVNMIT